MKRLAFVLALALAALAITSPACFAQVWSGLIPTGSGADWTLPGIPGGIPTGTQSGATITPTGSDQTTQIQTALNACGGSFGHQKFVLLSTGTFIIAGKVVPPNFCTLNGSDSTGTSLHCTSTSGGGCGQIGLAINNAPSAANDTAVTSGLTQGSSSVTVASAAHIFTGTLAMFSELNSLANGVNNTGSEGPCTFCDFPHGHTRDRGQIVLVTAVSGTSISFTPPLYHTYGTTLPSWAATTKYYEYTFITNGGHTYEQTANPGSPYNCTSSGSTPAFSTSGGSVSDGTCTWLDTGTGTTTAPLITPFQPASILAGFENLQFFTVNAGTSTLVGPNIVITQAEYPIVHGVSFNYTDADYIYGWYVFGGEIDQNYYSNAILHTPGTYDSTVQFAGKSSGVRIENGIHERGHTGVLFEDGASGNVFSYSYLLPGFDSGSPSVVIGGFDHHGAHTEYNLIEGNVLMQIYYDSVWGTSNFYTAYRNWVQGSGPLDNPIASGRQTVTGGSTVTCSAITTNTTCFPFQASRAFQVAYLSTNDNFVGNVTGSPQQSSNIGYGGGVTPYNSATAPQTDALRWSSTRSFDNIVYAYSFGYGESADDGSWPLDSTAAFASAFLDGNYGNISSLTVWATSPHALPASFYLPSKPVWWGGTLPYPAIGPDVTGAGGPGGHAGLIPAENCYANVMGGSTGAGTPLAFNAPTCYPSATPTTFTISAASTNPSSGVTISASPADTLGHTSCVTPCTFVYNNPTTATLTAPATSGVNTFSAWSGGCSSMSTVTCIYSANANITLTANFTSPTPPAVNPAIVMSASTTSAATGKTIQFTVTCQTMPCPAVTWTTNVGTISGVGLFTAGASAASGTVTAATSGQKTPITFPVSVIATSTTIASTCKYTETIPVPATRTLTINCNPTGCTCK